MIFYFTGTGNSLHVASRLAQMTNDTIIDIALAMKKNQFDYDLGPKEKVGFVFPTYFFGIPSIVEEFATKVSFNNKENYFYCVLTCGGNSGQADRMFAKILIKKAIQINASYQITMPDNYVLMYDTPSNELQESLLSAAEERMKQIASSINKREIIEFSKGINGYLFTKALYGFYRGGMSTKKFWADDKCIGCGQCVENCPCEAIVMKDGRPKWIKSKCTRCLSCIHRCPVQSIQYGKSTKKRNRYVNPILK